MKQFLKNNIVFLIYLLFSFALGVSTLLIVTGTALVRAPWISILYFSSVFLIYNLIRSKKGKCILLYCFSFFQILVNWLSELLFENTGTYFEYSMFKLVGGADQFAGTMSIDWLYISYTLLLTTLFVVLSIHFTKYIEEKFSFYPQPILCSLLLVATLIGQVGTLIYHNSNSEERFVNSLYKDTNVKYTNYGNIGNFINELAKMVGFDKYNDLSSSQINSFIYSETNTQSDKFGISEGNNLVTILVESLEWFAFISDTDSYPNGANITEEKLDELFPNLRAFYNLSVVMTNHHSQNKTDMSEDEALSGVYPSSAYINFNFADTKLPASTANMLNTQDESIVNKFFHNNDYDFYNRTKVVTSLGYEDLYFIEKMTEYGVTNYFESKESEHSNCMNVDSEMFNAMKDEMFPIDTRFNTHITTLSMHGSYVERVTMKKYLEKMDSLNVYIEDDHLRNYLSYVMDFDAALGIMMDDLSNKGLLDNTTIILFSDHNAYMSNLTYNVKDIKITEYDNKNYTDLYRVPLMIYDSNIEHQVINKFTTTYDIAPTILDMFGINHYTNLYYGTSIFNEEDSVLYSKAFDIFMADGLYFSNINNLLFRRNDVSDEYINEVEQECLVLLKKIYYMNNIFELNHFNDSANYELYKNKIAEIN